MTARRWNVCDNKGRIIATLDHFREAEQLARDLRIGGAVDIVWVSRDDVEIAKYEPTLYGGTGIMAGPDIEITAHPRADVS